MPKLFRPTYVDHRTGRWEVSRFWYARIGGKRVPLKVTDRKVAERKAVEMDRAAELGRDPGLVDRARRRPVAEHLADFEQSLQAEGCSATHVGIVVGRLRRLVEGGRIATLADDTTASAVEAWLAGRQRDGVMSAQTRNTSRSTPASSAGGWWPRGGRRRTRSPASRRTGRWRTTGGGYGGR